MTSIFSPQRVLDTLGPQTIQNSLDAQIKQESPKESLEVQVKQESPDDSSSESTYDIADSSPSFSLHPARVESESFDRARTLSNNDANDLRDGLELYIPVGVLKKPMSPDRFEEIVNLEKHDWIRTFTHVYTHHPEWCFVRIYVLPDDIRRKSIPRSNGTLRRALKDVMARVDRSLEAWNGGWTERDAHSSVDSVTAANEDSLWYIFNTLPNPDPSSELMRDPFARRAMMDLLSEGETVEDQPVAGLKTPLYAFQRRSAATMVQREAQPAQMLDPRLQACRTPFGQVYYYDKEEGSIILEKRMYSEPCGGILAESMGYGKTLICLAVILATRGHFPRIPTEYQDTEVRKRPSTASLVETAAAVAGRLSLPWKNHFDSLRHDGMLHTRCIEACQNNSGSYILPSHTPRYGGRRAAASHPRDSDQHIRICSGTLVIAPPNLVDHWEHEIMHHTEGLKVLVLRNPSDKAPPSDNLFQYDIVLFSRTRFEREADYQGSPFLQLHWLRVIVDEGHNAGGTGKMTTMLHFLGRLHFERRWIVSGTPGKGLYGVEVSLASRDSSGSDLPAATAAVLKDRKKTGSLVTSEVDAVSKLRYNVTKFLDVKPWSNGVASNDTANWTTYMTPTGEDGKRQKSPSLYATLKSLIVRHRSEEVHEETPLPPLHNKVTLLKPTFYDKLNLNLFIFIIAVNAVTSERTGPDYLFHSQNRKALGQTIRNLREAGFWWAGSLIYLEEAVKTAEGYMEKNQGRMSESDTGIITEGISIARKALACTSLQMLRGLAELGVFVQRFPEEAKEHWAIARLDDSKDTVMMGITQAREAQKSVTSNLGDIDPAASLPGDGLRNRLERERRLQGSKKNAQEIATHKTAPDKSSRNKSPKKSYLQGLFKILPSGSPLKQTQLVATTSAKLTYLLDKVQEYYQTEKIIIFYDNENLAYFICEGLDLLGIDFRIYANSLSPELRSKYLARFRQFDNLRIFLMDVHQASHGLHLANASRVFIVNPIWDPNVESQAIKRAHRIGQTREVHVETLILEDTLEHRMLNRRKNMSNEEIQHAEKDPLDDSTMSSIIQNEKFIPMSENETFHEMALLKHPAGFFDRHKLPIPDPVTRGMGFNPRHLLVRRQR
ncbi:SNF2 family helicase [Aspergillus sclerotialis]|uniref:SNF2 family helicase n=1 Tax=Aspergillus sclerotialis TaxID=2070753 RepID=A0A3A2ZR66_9EURO|nr:SNF2 family helicase [Aspergillus sclerotialis]